MYITEIFEYNQDEIRDYAKEHTTEEVLEWFEQTYGKSIKKNYFHRLAPKYNIEVYSQVGGAVLSFEDKKWLEENSKNYYIFQIMEHFNNKYNYNTIRKWCRKLGFKQQINISDIYVNHNFLDIDGPEQAYFLGLLASDGHAGNCIAFSMKDKDVLEIIKRLINTEHDIYKTYGNRTKIGKRTEIYNLYFSSAPIYAKLKKLGYTGSKSSTIEPIETNYNSHFIRGLFDGDGHIGIHKLKPQISYCSNSFKIVKYVHGYMKKITDTESKIYYDKRGSYSASIGGKQILSFLEWLYQDSDGLRMERKYDAYLDICDHYSK